MAEYILSVLEKLKIDISKCRGQTYDGAASMSGYKSGCYVHIMKLCALAFYLHCFSHKLNLCIKNPAPCPCRKC